MKNVIQKVKNHIIISELIFSCILAMAIFLMRKIHFEEFVHDNNYIEKIFFNELVVLLFYIPVIYLLIHGVVKHYHYFKKNTIKKEVINSKSFLIVVFVFLLIIYLLYYMSFFPGGVYIDTFTSLRMISNEKILDGYYQDFSFQQPPLYTLSMYIVKPFIPNYYMGFGIYCFIQIFMMVGMFTYFAYWLLKKNVSSFIVTLIIIFCGTFRLYPLYGVSLWKDTTFSIAFFLYCLFYIDIVIDIIKRKIQLKNIVLFSMFSVFTVFLRNNAKYILVACLVALIFLDSKKMCHNIREGKNNNYRLLITSQLLIIVFSIAIPPIVRLSLQVEKEHFAENIAIPIQQVARVVCVDGRITEEQKKLIEKVLPFDNIKKDYRALIVDPIKWDSKFDNKYLENHKFDFLKLWVSLFFRNPREYMQAYLLQTSGFWSFNVCSLREGYHSAINFESLNDKVQIKNVINDKYGINIQESMLALNKYSGGLFFWIYLASMLVSWRVNSKKYIICFLPAFFLWETIMIATPMGQSLRYVYILVLMLPLDFVLPSIISDVDSKE